MVTITSIANALQAPLFLQCGQQCLGKEDNRNEEENGKGKGQPNGTLMETQEKINRKSTPGKR